MHNAASCRLHQVFWVLANLQVDVVRSIFVKYIYFFFHKLCLRRDDFKHDFCKPIMHYMNYLL